MAKHQQSDGATRCVNRRSSRGVAKSNVLVMLRQLYDGIERTVPRYNAQGNFKVVKNDRTEKNLSAS